MTLGRLQRGNTVLNTFTMGNAHELGTTYALHWATPKSPTL
jgi:hypothetical protein